MVAEFNGAPDRAGMPCHHALTLAAGVARYVRPLTRLILLTAFMFAWLLVARTVQAGSYTVNYTGGQWNTTTLSGTYTPNNGGYKAYAWQGGLTSKTPASASFSGQITATFQWNSSGAGDNPPASVIVDEQCSASAAGYGTVTTPTVTAMDGFGDPTTTQPGGAGPNALTATSSGSRYSVIPNPGSKFQVFCSPSGSAGIPAGYVVVNLTYSAVATPVVFTVAGTTPGNGVQNILIGQGCSASMTAGSYTLQNYQWNVDGSTYKDYVAHGAYTGAYAKVDYMAPTDWQQPSPHWYWYDQGIEIISGTADVYVNNVKIGTAISGAKDVTVWVPYYFCGPAAGNIYVDPLLGSLGIAKLFAGSQETQPGVFSATPGIAWYGKTIPQDLFNLSGEGEWAFIQTVIVGRSFTSSDGVVHTATFPGGPIGLDTSYPYAPPNDHQVHDDSNSGWPDDDTLQMSDDSPCSGLNSAMVSYNVSDVYYTFMMYRPADIGNGNQWVPLNEITWNWNCAVVQPANGWDNSPIPSSSVGPVSVLLNARTTVFPTWYQVIQGQNGSYTPGIWPWLDILF